MLFLALILLVAATVILAFSLRWYRRDSWRRRPNVVQLFYWRGVALGLVLAVLGSALLLTDRSEPSVEDQGSVIVTNGCSEAIQLQWVAGATSSTGTVAPAVQVDAGGVTPVRVPSVNAERGRLAVRSLDGASLATLGVEAVVEVVPDICP